MSALHSFVKVQVSRQFFRRFQKSACRGIVQAKQAEEGAQAQERRLERREEGTPVLGRPNRTIAANRPPPQRAASAREPRARGPGGGA